MTCDILLLVSLVVAILWVVFGDDGVMSVEEYIRRHPEEFNRYRS